MRQPKELDNYWDTPPHQIETSGPIDPDRVYNTKALMGTTEFVTALGRSEYRLQKALKNRSIPHTPRPGTKLGYRIKGSDALAWLDKLKRNSKKRYAHLPFLHDEGKR